MSFNFARPAAAAPSFGASPAPTTSFGGFGAAPAAAPAAAAPGGFGGFGSPAPAAAPAVGGFGAPSPAPVAFGGFSAPAPAPALGGFGAPAAAPAPTASFGGFGAPAPAPAAAGAFGGYGTPACVGVGAQAQAAANVMHGYEGELRKFLDLRRQYAAVKQPGIDAPTSWESGERYSNCTSLDPAQKVPWNDDCLFRFTVYLDRALAAQLSNGDDLEPNAEENNPDPRKLAPVTLQGIHALKQQFNHQNELVQVMTQKVSAIKDSHIESFRSKSEGLAIRIKQYQNKHNEQNGRLIKLLRDVEYLRSRNRPLEKKEIEHRAEYDKLIGMKNQCTSRLLQLEETNDVYSRMAAHNTQEEYLEVSDEDLDRIYQLLREQHEGVHHLTKILEKDARDLEIMRNHSRGGSRGKHIESVQ